MTTLAYDIETDGLESKRIHCVVTQDIDTGLVEEYNDEKYSDSPKELPMGSNYSITTGLSSLMAADNIVSHNGIAYDVIKKKIPVINQEIAKVIANILEFEVFFESYGNKFDIFIKHPQYDERPIEMASGAEKTMAAMAIRLALLSVSSLPKGDLFILDEPGTALDEENMEGFIRILELIKVYFKNVLLISHLDSLKDCVDMQIVIEKKNGFARVNQ